MTDQLFVRDPTLVMREITSLRQQVETLTQERYRISNDHAAAIEAQRRLLSERDAAREQLASLAAAQERMTAFVAKIAAIGMCTDPSEESKCYMDSGPGCGAHWRNIDDEITEAREVLAALPSLAASSRETTDETKDDTRQSSPSPVRTTGSPRSPQPKGSEQ